jgi:hypothetical protein
MAQSFSDEEKEHEGTDEELAADDKDEEQISGKVKDTLDTEIEKQKEREKKKQERDAKLNKEIEDFDKEKKREKRLEFLKSLWRFLLSLFNPETYVGYIQKFEVLFFVVFVDITLGAMLFSIVYGLYIIINFENMELISAICKLVGCFVTCIIGVVIHNHLPENNPKNEGE